MDLKADVAVIKSKMRSGEGFLGRIITVALAVLASIVTGRVIK